MESATIQLIPNKHNRDTHNTKSIKNITGIAHFFLDHDLTSGFVHPYTLNFFNKLSADDFVLKFTSSSFNKNIGKMEYIRKGTMLSKDKLGKNIAYFRQWKLSEIDYKKVNGDILINVAPSNFSYYNYCPKAKPTNDKSIQSQIPILVEAMQSGYQSIQSMNKLDMRLGGTVVFIWEDSSTRKIYFQDLHSSWKDILLHAISIAKTFHVDPTIAIGDAGPYSPKYFADKNFNLDTKKIDDLFYKSEWFGAGFGYVPIEGNLIKSKSKNDSIYYSIKLKEL
jgi:hypothetical protein